MSERMNQATAGQEVIREAAALLEEMTLSHLTGNYREGTRLDIQVLPRLNQDRRTSTVFVTLHAFGHQTVDWAGLALCLRQTDEAGVAREFYALVNPHGHARFPSVPVGGDKEVTYEVTLDTVHWNVLLWQKNPQALGEQGPMLTWLDKTGAQRLCRILQEGAVNPQQTNSLREACLDALMGLTHQPGAIAQPAFTAWLSILCAPDTPLYLVARVAKSFSPSLAGKARGVDIGLEPYIEKLAQGNINAQKPEQRRVVFVHQARVFGAILAERPLDREDARQLVYAFVKRESALGYVRTHGVRTMGAVPIKGAVKTAGAVRTIGSAGTRGKVLESPLVELARAGGRRVRDFLVNILRKEPGNEALIEMLKASASK